MKNTIIILLCIATLCLTGCVRKEPLYKIGVSQCSDDEWRTQMNEEIKREAMFHDDVEVEIRISDDDNAKQIDDIHYFMDHDFDIIIVSPREANAISPAIREAYERGIPVIVFDRAIHGETFTSYMKLDNEGIGRAAAEYAVQSLRGAPAQVIELRGLDDSSPARDRHQGFSRVMDSVGNITIAASVPAYWKKEAAFAAMDSLLDIHPDVDIIYAHNDLMALGASEAVRKHNLTGIKIIGTDAAPSLGMRAVADSLIDATFIYPTEGERVIRTALAILRGEHYERIDLVPAHYAVDKANADILLRQDKLLGDRTAKLEVMNSRNLLMQSRHRTQRNFLIAAVVAGVLLVIVTLSLFRYLRQKSKYEKILNEKNRQLSAERDRQAELYTELEEATRSKLVFFTNVSHDLRTPLTLISEPVSQVAEAAYLTPAHRSMMQLAMRNVRILRRMIEQILDFRQYQNGKTELRMEELCPARYISEWSDAFRAIAASRRLKFDVDIQASSTASAAVDLEKLERVFFNLVSNAFKYTRNGGEVKVAFSMTDSQIILQVSDTGIGISREDRKRIFDRFYQVDKVHPSGSGIGLSLTKAFVEVMGGEISVESEPGKGSVFTVSLPLVHMTSASESASPLRSEADSQFEEEVASELLPVEKEIVDLDNELPLLLAIDDNPDILTLVQELLPDTFNIITATDGATGLRLARKYIPSLIISDLMMPGMDGLEFCRKIKGEVSTSHIPVVILTACRLDEQRAQSYESGADSYISKPFSAHVLRSRIENLLENRERIKDLYSVRPADEQGRDLPATNDPNAIESDFYRRFIDLVAEGYRDSELSLKDIAANIGMGSTQLSRKIKALTALTPVEIIRRYRLREARKLIMTTDLSISEIAYETGFSSPQYFSRCFREVYNESPSDLRL